MPTSQGVHVTSPRKAATVAGYAGFYRGAYLRSTLEYLYALLLDEDGVEWVYEPKTYPLSDGTSYKPDFQLADGEFAEVKGEYTLRADLPKINRFEAEYGAAVKLIREADLKAEYKRRGKVYSQHVQEWQAQAKRLGQDVRGELNPRYGVPAAESTRRLIGGKAQERWEAPAYREKMTAAFRGRSYDHFRGPRVERVHLTCRACGASFEVMPAKADRLYCSLACANVAGTDKARTGAAGKKRAAATQAAQIVEVVNRFIDEHPALVLGCAANAISSTLAECWGQLEAQIGVKDFRTIALAITGKHGRKEMLLTMKERAQNIVRADGN